jgi:diadenosine tetraphosphate (Ap4A) HIT family hydrolase
MSEEKECAFCEPRSINERIIRLGRYSTSFLSSPWFRPGHSLVIPNRHITTASELEPNESIEIMAELGRLSLELDQGFGSGIMQKYQPTQSENGIKVNHLHFHVFPRQENEQDLFPTPRPNNFSGFYIPNDTEIKLYTKKLS